jgi:hypothetical protein
VFHRGERFATRLYVPINALSVLARSAKENLRTCLCLMRQYQVPLGIWCVSLSANHGATVMLAGALTTLTLVAEHERRHASIMNASGAYSDFGAMCAAAGAARRRVSC